MDPNDLEVPQVESWSSTPLLEVVERIVNRMVNANYQGEADDLRAQADHIIQDGIRAGHPDAHAAEVYRLTNDPAASTPAVEQEYFPAPLEDDAPPPYQPRITYCHRSNGILRHARHGEPGYRGQGGRRNARCYASPRPFADITSSAVREDYFADGRHALGYDSDASEDGPITIGGDWSVFTNNISLRDHEVLRFGQGRAEHLSPHPSSFYGGYPRERLNAVFRTPLNKSPMPCMENPLECSDHGQVRAVPGIPDFEVPVYLRNPRVHWMFHGSYNVPSSKLHVFSIPHARANFMGRDLPSLTYEDPAPETVPAFWINPTPEIYQPASCWWHPLYTVERFSRAIPTLRDWNDWLELNFRARWRLGTRRQQYLIPTCMEQSGTLFEEFHNRWVAYSLFMHLNLGDFSDGEFRLNPNGPQWPGLLG